jgi:hypothetical protein
MSKCIASFFELEECEDPYALVHITDDVRYWHAKAAQLFTTLRYKPPMPQAVLAKLGDRYILVLGSREREPNANLMRMLIEEARRRFGISDEIAVEEVRGRYIDNATAVLLRINNEEYVFHGTEIPLPVYFSKNLTIMAYVVRASVLSNEEEQLVAMYWYILEEINELIRNINKYAVGKVEIPEEIHKHIDAVFKPSREYRFKSRVLIVRGDQVKEQALKEIRDAIEVAKAYLIPELKRILIKAMILT